MCRDARRGGGVVFGRQAGKVKETKTKNQVRTVARSEDRGGMRSEATKR